MNFTLCKNFTKRLSYFKAFIRKESILILAEHDNEKLSPVTFNAIEAARRIGGDLTVLVAGTECHCIATEISKTKGLKRVLIAEDNAFDGFPAENLTPLILSTQKKYHFTHILAGSTTFGKSVLPRVAAKLDVPLITDITQIRNGNIFKRPIYAGNALMTLKINDPVKVLTINESDFIPCIIEERRKLRTTLDVVNRALSICKVHCDDKHNRFKKIEYLRLKRAADSISHWKLLEDVKPPIEQIYMDGYNQGLTELLKHTHTKSKKLKLAKAKIIICGGKGIKSEDNFELLYTLAQKLGGEVGATRSAVDEGYAPSDLLIDTFGTKISPNLYIGIGISGQPQHMAAIQCSKIIVAINNDSDAPIFNIANYGLVAKFSVIHELIAKL